MKKEGRWENDDTPGSSCCSMRDAAGFIAERTETGIWDVCQYCGRTIALFWDIGKVVCDPRHGKGDRLHDPCGRDISYHFVKNAWNYICGRICFEYLPGLRQSDSGRPDRTVWKDFCSCSEYADSAGPAKDDTGVSVMRKTIWKWGLFLFVFLFLTIGQTKKVNASDEENAGTWQTGQDVLEEFDFTRIDRMLSDIFPEKKISFREILEALMSGEDPEFFDLFLSGVRTSVASVLTENKEALVHIFVIALIAAVFVNFSHIFTNKQVAETGFFILYLLLITILLKSFGIMIDSVAHTLTILTDFMKVLCPLYFLASAFATGSTTAMLFYNLMLVLIYLVETVILHMILPMIHVYILVRILDHISPEPYLTRLGELLEMIVRWTLKTMLICIAGINIIQGLVSPALDAVRRSGLQKGIETIPGVGSALGGMTEVLLSSVVLIRNGIGAAGAVVCVVICIIPIFQIGLMTLLFKLIAAVTEPISDSRIVSCISGTGDGAVLLLRAVYTSAVLFLLTIVVVASFRL